MIGGRQFFLGTPFSAGEIIWHQDCPRKKFLSPLWTFGPTQKILPPPPQTDGHPPGKNESSLIEDGGAMQVCDAQLSPVPLR